MLKKKTRLQVSKDEPKKEITIHNMRYEKPYYPWDVRCDRASPLGSPFHLGGDESKRDWVCDKYFNWFKTQVLSGNEWEAYEELMRIRDIYRTQGKLRIFCWCASKRCHTETIKMWLEGNN